MALDYHFQTIGFILKDLLDHGLRKVNYSAENSMEVMLYRAGDEDEVHATFNDVLHWMIDEGLIRTDSIQDGDPCDYFNGVQLTSKGIAIVQAKPPEGSDLEYSIVKTIQEPPKGGLGADVYAKIGSAVGGLLGGLAQAMGGG
ncbi:hypothetical protein ACFSQT_35835 [Mesorhizobium calcicola]|uniref:Uncharacterized protein n=1 Tax=Mesorhizobium calcicola TaxID=1300310 RepID=A0ABW4WNW6_9HYPH